MSAAHKPLHAQTAVISFQCDDNLETAAVVKRIKLDKDSSRAMLNRAEHANERNALRCLSSVNGHIFCPKCVDSTDLQLEVKMRVTRGTNLQERLSNIRTDRGREEIANVFVPNVIVHSNKMKRNI